MTKSLGHSGTQIPGTQTPGTTIPDTTPFGHANQTTTKHWDWPSITISPSDWLQIMTLVDDLEVICRHPDLISPGSRRLAINLTEILRSYDTKPEVTQSQSDPFNPTIAEALGLTAADLRGTLDEDLSDEVTESPGWNSDEDRWPSHHESNRKITAAELEEVLTKLKGEILDYVDSEIMHALWEENDLKLG